MLYSLEQWQSDLIKSSNNEKVAVLKGFFKTGKGEYGEGDEFIGVTVPENRKIAKKAITLDFSDYAFMLQSSVHEFRLSALIALGNMQILQEIIPLSGHCRKEKKCGSAG